MLLIKMKAKEASFILRFTDRVSKFGIQISLYQMKAKEASFILRFTELNFDMQS